MDHNVQMLILMLGSRLDPNAAALLMFIYYISPWIINRLPKWGTESTLTIESVDTAYGPGNEAMFYGVCMLLAKLNTSAVRSERIEGRARISNGYRTLIDINGSINFKGSLIKYVIQRGEKNKVVTLTCASIDVLNLFAHKAHKDYIKVTIPTPDNIYEFENGIWEPSKINVNKTRANIYLDDAIEDKIFRGVETFQSMKVFYQAKGIPYKKSFLFQGPPGTGKSATVYAMSNHFSMPIYYVTADVLKNSNTIANAFRPIKKGIVLFEEIDLIFRNEAPAIPPDDNSADKTVIVKSDGESMLRNLLNTLDGYSNLAGCVLVFTTNYPDKIDSRIKRPGRVDEIINFTSVSPKTADRILTDFCGRVCPVRSTMMTSQLINEIILPNINDFDRVCELCA